MKCGRRPGRWGGEGSVCCGARLPRGGELLPSRGPQGPGRGRCRYWVWLLLRQGDGQVASRNGHCCQAGGPAAAS